MKMTKKELEDREIKLEAIVDAYQKLIENFLEKFPVHFPQFEQLENVSLALFNSAEVRTNIEELVSYSFEYGGNQ